MPHAYRVIVVGGAGDGLAVAVQTDLHGADVMVLEVQSQPSGVTGITVDSFTTVQTDLQETRRGGQVFSAASEPPEPDVETGERQVNVSGGQIVRVREAFVRSASQKPTRR